MIHLWYICTHQKGDIMKIPTEKECKAVLFTCKSLMMLSEEQRKEEFMRWVQGKKSTKAFKEKQQKLARECAKR